MRRLWVVLLAVIVASCTKLPVQDEVTIEFSDSSDTVFVTADTRFDLRAEKEEAKGRIETARELAQSGTDAWSVRFGRVTADTEQVTLQKSRGELERVTRLVAIDSDDLPRVFSDVSITMNVTRGDGWRELAIYPGASSRATREQQRQFDEALRAWSGDVARYFTNVRHLYRYMDENPNRAEPLFTAVFAIKDQDAPPLSEEEEPLVKAVAESMETIAKRMDETNARAETLSESADLIFNPFPARMIVKVKGAVLSSEGFTKDLTIEPVDLLETVGRLEGRWISPDPLASLLKDAGVTAKQLAEMPRRTAPVTSAGDVMSALREQLARPRAYVVRWRE